MNLVLAYSHIIAALFLYILIFNNITTDTNIVPILNIETTVK